MASAQLTEEELQQSAVLSEEDAEFEDAPNVPAGQIPQTTESPLTNPNTYDDELSDVVGDEEEERDASAIEDDVEMGENPDDNSELSEQESLDEELDHQSDEDMDQHMEQDERDGASGGARSRSSSLLDDIEEDEAEGVGAVKIRPGETDDEEADEPESDHSDSHSESGNESDGDAAWDEVAAADDDDEEGSEDAAPNTCMFCKQDEEHDPAEDFEDFLTCVDCGENWKPALFKIQACLDCALGEDAPVNEAEGEAAQEQEHENADENEDVKKRDPEVDLELSPSSRRSTASQVARDLLPPQKGSIKPDSHSVFNHLLLDGDPMDGSRVLRKRKTSSIEADDIVMSLRKRRRNTSKDRESSHGAGTSQDGPNGTREKGSRRKLRLNATRKAQSVTVTRRTRSIVIKMRKVYVKPKKSGEGRYDCVDS
ncbi:uncharacterized protein ColSpa_04262 [Colletotrichum spaethianum]|uniref:Uncharacterized protein n=1 Tax=Colletotrichum spaethianum TaxID=700344 RepID=A0AA37L8N4_9PEZI|nr:uncharacterized protein ColSpa_04262 [Colletotrichum spaethianum]GKT44081.1 hypothetical protein ColSpa_04262 [Colletotrichum spaethianum]